MYPNGDTQYRAIKITLIFNCLSKLLPNMFISLEQTHIFKTSIKTELIILNAPIGEVVCLSNSRQELMSINIRHPQKTLNLHPQRKVSHFPGGQGPGAKSSIQRAWLHKDCSSEPKEVWTVGPVYRGNVERNSAGVFTLTDSLVSDRQLGLQELT